MNKKTVRDLILAASLIAIALVFIVIRNASRTDGGMVEVKYNGESFGVYSLSEDREIDIDGKCTLSVSDGCAKMTYADCSAHICTAHAPIRYGGEAIVCLPNRVSVRVIGDEFDFVS